LDELVTHLRNLELMLFDPAVRSSRVSLEVLLSPQFQEIGSSGRLFGFAEIVDALLAEDLVISRELTDFRLTMLSESLALVTYEASRKVMDGGEIRSIRSSIWRDDGDKDWRMLFHQGTLMR
jgi:hypothetical protein